MDPYDLIASAVMAIRSDPELKECFNRILAVGSMTQQVRVATLLAEIERRGAPDDLKQFIRLLGNDQLAHQVLLQINS